MQRPTCLWCCWHWLNCALTWALVAESPHKHTPCLYSASTCPSRNNITPCYCSSMPQSRAIHNTKRLVWENIIVVLEQNGKRGLVGETEARIVSLRAIDLLHCCFLLQVHPPPPAREAQPNDGKVIHHWSTTAANWISPPPINMQSGLAKVSRKGWGGLWGRR